MAMPSGHAPRYVALYSLWTDLKPARSDQVADQPAAVVGEMMYSIGRSSPDHAKYLDRIRRTVSQKARLDAPRNNKYGEMVDVSAVIASRLRLIIS